MTRQRVVIVGGGIAGASLGSELARDHSVILLEAERLLATHSTGRSAALYLSGYGPPPVRELTRRSRDEFIRISSLPHMAPVWTQRGGLFTAWDEPSAEALQALLASRPSMRTLSTDQARDLCPVLRTDFLLMSAVDDQVGDIDVNALHSHYADLLRSRGGEIVLGAKLVAADRSNGGWGLRTGDGQRWRADAVVNAAGAWGDEVAELCAGGGYGLSPRRRTIVLARASRPLPAGCPVVADAAETWFLKPQGAEVMLSPCDETPAAPGDVRAQAADIASALERVNAATTLNLHRVHASWAGLRTFVPDRVPLVGPHPAEPTLFSFVGQGGYGIQMAPALAEVGAELFRTGTLTDAELAAAIDPGRDSSRPASSLSEQPT